MVDTVSCISFVLNKKEAGLEEVRGSTVRNGVML